jgi:hypothetical protein
MVLRATDADFRRLLDTASALISNELSSAIDIPDGTQQVPFNRHFRSMTDKLGIDKRTAGVLACHFHDGSLKLRGRENTWARNQALD